MLAKRNHTYSLLSEKGLPDSAEEECNVSQRQYFAVSKMLVAVLSFSNVLLIAFIIRSRWQPHLSSVSAWSILGDSPVYPVPYQHFSNYSSPKEEEEQEISMRWKNLIPEHGVVALDHIWAASKGLPQSMSLPSDNTKGVYMIDAYHSLHCLLSIRRSWFAQHKRSTKTYEHYSHCFDYLLQSIACNPSDHLFSVWPGGAPGDQEERQCRDWRVIRDWATSHSICDPNDTENQNSQTLRLKGLCPGTDDFVPYRIKTV